MFDNRVEAARVLDEPRWLRLNVAHGVLFRPGDKPRMTNKKSEDMVLEDEVVSRIASGAELLALPKSAGGFDDLAAFHALNRSPIGDCITMAVGAARSETIGVCLSPACKRNGTSDSSSSRATTSSSTPPLSAGSSSE